MDYFNAYREPLAAVFEEAAKEAGAFPGKAGTVAKSLVDACNPLIAGRKSNYIAYLLPFWTDELAGRGEAVCRDLAVGSVCAMLQDRKSTRLNSSHIQKSRMPSSA